MGKGVYGYLKVFSPLIGQGILLVTIHKKKYMRLTEYIDYLNNGKKNEKRFTHFTVKSKRFGGFKNSVERHNSK